MTRHVNGRVEVALKDLVVTDANSHGVPRNLEPMVLRLTRKNLLGQNAGNGRSPELRLLCATCQRALPLSQSDRERKSREREREREREMCARREALRSLREREKEIIWWRSDRHREGSRVVPARALRVPVRGAESDERLAVGGGLAARWLRRVSATLPRRARDLGPLLRLPRLGPLALPRGAPDRRLGAHQDPRARRTYFHIDRRRTPSLLAKRVRER